MAGAARWMSRPGLHLLEVHPSWAAAFVLLAVGAMVAAWQAYRAQTLRFVLKRQEISTHTDAQADIAPELLVMKESSPDSGGASGS